MACRRVQKRISLYIDGLLPERERSAVEAHLRACEGCGAYLGQMRRALASFDALERVEPRPGGWERLRDRLEAGTQPASAPSYPRRWGWAALGAAAVVLIAGALMWRPVSREIADLPKPPVHNRNLNVAAPEPIPEPGDQLDKPDPAAPDSIAANAAETFPTEVAPAPHGARAAAPKSHHPGAGARRTVPSSDVARGTNPQGPPLPDPASLAGIDGLEPDPELGHAAAVAEASGGVGPATAELVSSGLSPLVAAAQAQNDPVEWLYDIRAEDWL